MSNVVNFCQENIECFLEILDKFTKCLVIFAFQRFPFDSKDPVGYLIAVILEYIMYGYDCFIIACTLALGVGAFWFAACACKEIQHILNLINAKAHAKKHRNDELKVFFEEFINTHLTVKQLSMIAFLTE